MARRYYNTVQDVYKLFKNHPALSQMLDEFEVSDQAIKEVADFFINNDEKISSYNLKDLYTTSPTTLEPDQPSPLAIYVDDFSSLPENPNQDRTYYVTNPYPGEYYKFNGTNWVVDTNFQSFTTDEYKKYQQDTGHLIWEDESGYFVFIEGESGYYWEKLSGFTPGAVGSVIRKSDLPTNGINPGDIYEVRGEDILDVVAVLYGFVAPEYYPPWGQYVSTRGTNLLELLKFTLYYYRYATIDNFYEKHIFDFIPEYDRNYILSKPKMKLFLEGIGRNLDNIEDKVSRIPDLYNLDETPEELLDYVGQILGYEREDFSLANVSFRELLKNIIEIYKIKGTNYSFSFFFKFLGFNINLKEFYFNRDVANPESFPGIDNTKVEYYLTTQNPIYETGLAGPASYLEQIRDLNDWEFEMSELKSGGCNNPIDYMLGRESYNMAGQWHSNPWTYFKTNLIEYELNPFLTKTNLTASDNKTIRKYIRFLSPTYLFTWINVNLNPWIDSYDIHTEMEEKLNLEIQKTMGDYVDPETGDLYIFNGEDYFEKVRNGKFRFRDYEKMEDYLDIYNGGEQITFSIINYLDLGGEDVVGTVLKRDGIHIRQPSHPNHITGAKHNGEVKLNFDNLSILIKDYESSAYNYEVEDFSELPGSAIIGENAFVESENKVYVYKNINYWEDLGSGYTGIVNGEVVYETQLYQLDILSDGLVYKVNSPPSYFIYHDLPAQWVEASLEDKYKNWKDFSFRPYPDTPSEVSPNNVNISTNSLKLIWEEIDDQTGYNLQISTDNLFENIVEDVELDTTVYTVDMLSNNNYYWRVRVKNVLGQWGEWSSIFSFKVYAIPFPYDGEIINKITPYITPVKDNNIIEKALFNIIWPEADEYEKYKLQVAHDENFENIAYNIETNQNTFSVDLPNDHYIGKEYFWRYKIFNNDQWTDWSEYTFTIQL